MKKRNVQFGLFCLGIALFTVGCKKDKTPTTPPTNNATSFATGWSGTDNPATVPAFLSTFGNSNNMSNPSSALPSSIDLVQYMPPVGNQAYGTCVAWATAYYAKTISEAVKNGWNSNDVAQATKQLSSRDLFTSIDDNAKGAVGCDGTNYIPALAKLQSRGVATEALVVSKTGTYSCSQFNIQPNWTTEANNHKIKYYRRLSKDVLTIKKCLANKIPVLFAAIVGDQFSSYRGGIITNTTQTSSSPNGIGGHAMTLVGYNDADQTFKIVNSWGTGWGEQGFARINYQSFINFVRDDNLYIFGEANDLSNTGGSGTPDLVPWVFSDFNNTPTSGIVRQRKITFNLYNVGNGAALPSKNWDFYYVYYNAFNANDYGILFSDKFNAVGAANTYSCPMSNSCTFNYSIPAGGDFANTVFSGNTSVNRTYTMPIINGQYFLLLFADATAQIGEQSEQNNLFYTTGQSPVTFVNGVAARNSAGAEMLDFKNELRPTFENLTKSVYNSALNIKGTLIERNNYSPEEIAQFFVQEKSSGRLALKVAEYKQRILSGK